MRSTRLSALVLSWGLLLSATCAFAADVTDADYYSPYNYAGSTSFTITNYTGEAVSYFPVYLTISEALIPGFHYADLKNGTDDLVFFDSTGRVLDYELVDGWNPGGETRLWIRLPSFRDGETVRMCWNLRDGCTKPASSDATKVWSDYAGVWHMDEEVDVDAATAQTPAADSTENGYDLVPRLGPEGVYYTQVSAAGVFGNARINDTAARYKQKGSYFEMSGTEDLALNGVFTLSFWLKVDDYAHDPRLAGRRGDDGTGFEIIMNASDRKQLLAHGDNATGSYNTIVDDDFKNLGYTHLAFVYNDTTVSIYANGVCKVDAMTIEKATDNGLPIVIGNKRGGNDQSVWGKYDEVRLYPGVRSVASLVAECQMGTNPVFWTYGTVTNDASAVLKNTWKKEPTITKTTWDADDPTDRPTLADFQYEGSDYAAHGTATISFYDKTTGADLGATVPRKPGEYRAIISVAESRDAGVKWGTLEYTIDFRIVSNSGEHDFGINIDRILLANDDYSISDAVVGWQSYDDEDDASEYPFWRHLDEDGADDSTSYDPYWSVSLDFNLGGGVRHQYSLIQNSVTNRFWDLGYIRIGNTFNNGEDLDDQGLAPEQDAQGLQPDQNYLPWNRDSQRVLIGDGSPVGPYHRYASHLVMQNVTNAWIGSSLYTNGIGTIYFDAVNGWTNNVFNAEGDPNYVLVVEIATNCVDHVDRVPTDDAISSNPDRAFAYDPFLYADWKRVPAQILRFDNGVAAAPVTADTVTMTVMNGGSYDHFYRVIVPVNIRGPVRFRIRRLAIDPDQSFSPDGSAYILIDNLICSVPPDCVNLESFGRYDVDKTGQQVLGWEGALNPAFPSADDAIYGRAKASMANGGAVPEGAVSSATMHYRWHYIEQKTTPWLLADLDPVTFETRQPLDVPQTQGDIEYWFDLNQTGSYYEYVDYSGTGFNLADSGYCEAITSVTNHAPNYATEGEWFVRMRDGTSHFAEMVLRVKTSASGTVQSIPLWVSDNHLWRGYYRTKEALDDGFWWRIEPRDEQTDGATEWNSGTNYWYVADWTDTLPTFPATGRMSEGTTNSWARMTCDAQTGYLMFQVDESTRGITVLHADYQNFNDWNAPNTFFKGSSSEPNEKQGTSSDIKTYSEIYTDSAYWKAQAAKDDAKADDWQTHFDELSIGDCEGYKTFAESENFMKGWDFGKGMWVYGKYREAASHIAYQAAGCGEGRADFVVSGDLTEENWPRGIGSVSFNARLAQTLSPDMMAYVEDSSRLTNYTFMVRGCFDMKQNEGFAGNAALSLFAYYREGVGAYEARWEQIGGEQTTNPDYPPTYLGPQKKGQRLVISRWNASGSTYKETVLYAVTNSVSFRFDMPTMPYADGQTATNNLLPICLSVYQLERNGPTYVVVGVRAQAGEKVAGVAPNAELTVHQPGSGTSDADWYFATYKDSSSQKLSRGTYGVLSSNCEGLFLRPQYMPQPAWPGNYLTPQEIPNNGGLFSRKRLVAASTSPAFSDCLDDIRDGYWSVNGGREAAFIGANASTDKDFGFAYVAEPQTIDIYTSPLNKNQWTLRCQMPITNFGTPYNQPDCSTNLYLAEGNYNVRFRTGGELDDYRKDVTLSDIVITQWRGRDNWSTAGSDWNFNTDEPATGSYNNYGYTNIVFTSGWLLEDGTVRLSAKRTSAGYPCSVRSPLFDGLYQTGYGYRSVGLGQIGFRYREPSKNIRLLVQVVTNYSVTSGTPIKDMTRSLSTEPGYWTTIETLTYDDLMGVDHWSTAKNEGEWVTRLGWHGVRGMMRVVIDDALTTSVASETDPTKFGEIDILEVICKDEPALDKGCWWGWNLKTVGDAYDTVKRMYLADYAPYMRYLGQSMALNNSITDGTDPEEDTADFAKHLPFVQSPTFTNALLGQISFKARKYDVSDRSPDAKVVIYGALRNPDDLEFDDGWTKVSEFDITNTLYETFTCKTQNDHYYALRLAVLIDGTTNPPEPAPENPQRVLLDEVVISEAVSAMLSFRNVGAFREGLDTTGYVEGVTTKEQQPLCDENWGIQAEVFATMLEDEICTESNAVVTLFWYEGTTPWGYENWKDKPTGHARLAEVPGTNFVYRSSYDLAPDAVMPAQTKANTVVQYMLRVEYWTVHSDKGTKTYLPATNWLDSVAWSTPSWYAPLDYNADPQYGGGETFAGYTILDTVAPGWAWINEMNIYGGKTTGGGNADKEFQYVEVCAPVEANLSGWRVRFLEQYLNSDEVRTNNVALFGAGTLSGTKTQNMASNMVFHCVGNKVSEQLKKSDGSLDAVWSFSYTSSMFMYNNGLYYIGNTEIPFGVQLVRPSGIIEHSIVVVGTNRWGSVGYSAYDPTNVVAKLNKNVPGSNFFYASDDCAGTFRSASVIDSQGESAEHWANDWYCSPGYVNTNGLGQVQQIAQHPTPKGDAVIVYATVDRSGGPICQRVGAAGSVATNDFELIILRKGGEGTNIVYTVDPWYEVAGVTTNAKPAWVPSDKAVRELSFTVGKGASNSITVVATAMVDRDLSKTYGLTEDNPYTPAVMAWLHDGGTLKRDFVNNGTIVLADYVAYSGRVVTNMTLTQMYWLDMDPTISNQIFKAGMTKTWPNVVDPLEKPVEGYEGQNVLNNVRMRVYMCITNELDGFYSPYVLRGLVPGSVSTGYDSLQSPNWTSETFKVTGIFANGLTSEKNKQHWVPLRWFVFDEDSFYKPGNAEGHEPYTTDIEIIDPLSISSPGADAGWYDWVQEHGGTRVPVFNSWSLDTRLKNVAPEMLKCENFLD